MKLSTKTPSSLLRGVTLSGVLVVTLSGCAHSSPAGVVDSNTADSHLASNSTEVGPTGENLVPLVLQLDEKSGKENALLWVEVADTAAEREQGLMGREPLPDDHGMLFLLEEVRGTTVWMKNTPNPLDIIFIDEDGVIVTISENAEPNSIEQISSRYPVKAMLEVRAGLVADLGLTEGDLVRSSIL